MKLTKIVLIALFAIATAACTSSPTEAEYAAHYPIGPAERYPGQGHYQWLSDEHRRLGNHEISNTYQEIANKRNERDYTAFDLFVDIITNDTKEE